MIGDVTSIHSKGFLEMRDLTFELPACFISFIFWRHLRMFTSISRQNQTLGGEENMLATQVNVCYIQEHLEDRKVLSVHIYYTWCDTILVFKLHRRTQLTPCSSLHSLKIRMTSHPCNKYEQITLSYLPHYPNFPP